MTLFHICLDKMLIGFSSMEAILVDPITTEAMRLTLEANQTPFALLRPVCGIPVLVRVLPAGDKQMLVPATADDLKKHANISITPKIENESQEESNGISQSIYLSPLHFFSSVVYRSTSSLFPTVQVNFNLQLLEPPHRLANVLNHRPFQRCVSTLFCQIQLGHASRI